MIKRKAVTSFLALAGILFLAHAVVPHHHHGNLVCFANSHCDYHGTESGHDNSPESHHHDGEDCSDHCILKDPVVLSSTQLTAGLKFFDKKCTPSGDDNLRSSWLADEAKAPAVGLWYSLSGPPVHFLYSCFSSSSIGLRAPPAV